MVMMMTMMRMSQFHHYAGLPTWSIGCIIYLAANFPRSHTPSHSHTIVKRGTCQSSEERKKKKRGLNDRCPEDVSFVLYFSYPLLAPIL